MVKRHGGLIELGIAGDLITSERFVVLTNVALPVTKGAAQLCGPSGPAPPSLSHRESAIWRWSAGLLEFEETKLLSDMRKLPKIWEDLPF